MASKSSAALLAALIAAAPAGLAFAQTTTPTVPSVTDAAKAAGDAANAAGAAATDAAKAATDAAAAATTNAANAAADAAKTAADAAGAAASDAAQAAADSVKAATGTETPAATPAADAPAAAATDAAPGTAPAATTTPAPAEAANAAAAPSAPATAPEYYTKSTHDDWTLRCMKTPDGKDPCELYQLLKDAKGTPVSEVSMVPFTGKAAAILNIVAPLQTDLQAGLGVQVDAGKNNAYPFMVCAPVGCVARIGLTDGELGNFKKGNKVNVSLLPFGADPANDVVKLEMSLKGFTAGFDALSKVVKETQAP